MRGRFAPSPTGELHLGNMSTALCAWLQARNAGGKFVVRMEDLDRPRVVPGLAEAQLQTLRALGLQWDEGPGVGGAFGPYVQSERGEHYQRALGTLSARGLLYPCYCSRSALQQRSAEAGDEVARYPGTCRDLGPKGRAERELDGGPPPALRFRVRPGVVSFRDGLWGDMEQDVLGEVGDFVVLRRDEVVAYQLAVVVDDLAMRISHVLRGADLLMSTPRQLLLYEALGAAPPVFTHVPIWLGTDGAKLGKRHGPVGVSSLLASGVSPEAILAQLAEKLGLLRTGSLEELTAAFSLERLSRAPITWGR